LADALGDHPTVERNDFSKGLPARVWTKEKVTDRPSHPVSKPSLREVVWAVVEHVAPLAQALEVGRRAVRWVVIEMGCGENDARSAEPVEVGAPGWNAPVSMTVAPAGVVTIEPSPVREAKHLCLVATLADLAAALCPTESDLAAQLGPVNVRGDKQDGLGVNLDG